MSRHKDKGRIEGPFVPMLIQTTSCPAWRAMSPYAREVYRVLKSHYGFDARNNGRIYVSDRDGAEETGFNKDTVGRAFRELQHYGFIVMTAPGCLGVNGKGKAPHWRLTELGYMRDPPTRDFLKWNGELFREQKSPRYYMRKKQNPVRPNRTGCPATPDIPVSDQTGQLPDKVSDGTGHTDGIACPTAPDISRVNHSVVPEYSDLDQPDLRGMPRDMSWYYKLTERRIASVGASVATLGTLDAGLIVTNPGDCMIQQTTNHRATGSKGVSLGIEED